MEVKTVNQIKEGVYHLLVQGEVSILFSFPPGVVLIEVTPQDDMVVYGDVVVGVGLREEVTHYVNRVV